MSKLVQTPAKGKRTREQINALRARARFLINAPQYHVWEEYADPAPGEWEYDFGDPNLSSTHVLIIPYNPAAPANLYRNRPGLPLVATLCDCPKCASGALEATAFVLRTRPDLRKAVGTLMHAAKLFGPFEIEICRGRVSARAAK